MAEETPNKNSSFFSNTGTSPIKQQKSGIVVQKTKTGQMALNAIQDNNLMAKTDTNISFSDTVKPKNKNTDDVMLQLNKIKQPHAIKYTKDSIDDLNQKMNNIKSLTTIRDGLSPQAPVQSQNSNLNTQVTNNVNNVTNILSDYMRNIKDSYRQTPSWRAESG
jgi:hypothetical protein